MSLLLFKEKMGDNKKEKIKFLRDNNEIYQDRVQSGAKLKQQNKIRRRIAQGTIITRGGQSKKGLRCKLRTQRSKIFGS